MIYNMYCIEYIGQCQKYYELNLMTTTSTLISKHMIYVFIDIKLFNFILEIQYEPFHILLKRKYDLKYFQGWQQV